MPAIMCAEAASVYIIYFSIELKTGNSKSRSLLSGKGKLAGSYSTNRRGLLLL